MENLTLIRQCLSGEAANAQETFNQIMFARIADNVEARRQEVSQTLYLHQSEE